MTKWEICRIMALKAVGKYISCGIRIFSALDFFFPLMDHLVERQRVLYTQLFHAFS